jgi:NAD(P)-dependent dehydrogenase (short-subunit alcohol dehydrogenase family)
MHNRVKAGIEIKENQSSRVALITGASGGIGSACVRKFLSAGWQVSATALPGPDLERLAGPDVLIVPGDITSEEVRQRIVGQTLARFGKIDVLVNNAGVGLYALPANVPQDLMLRLFDVNVFAALALTQAVIPSMRRRGSGSIVDIGSVAAFAALPWAAAYCASKSALHSFNDALRRELRKEGILVIKICPGIVDTAFRSNVLGGGAPAKVADIKRVVSPDAVAAATLRGIEKRSRTVYVPQIGRLFRLVEFVSPGLIDWYTGRLAASTSDSTVESESPTVARPQ